MPALTFASRAAIDQIETERDIQELLMLFKAFYFDGNTHTLDATDAATVDLEFPEAAIFFGTSPLPQGSNLMPQIHTLLSDNRPDRKERTGFHTRDITRDLLITHLVRVAHSGNNEGKASVLCRRVADRLRSLLEHSPALELARKGFHRIAVQSGPTELPMGGYAVRQLTWTCRIRMAQTLSTV